MNKKELKVSAHPENIPTEEEMRKVVAFFSVISPSSVPILSPSEINDK